MQTYIQKQLDDAPDMTSTPAVFVNDTRVAGFTYEAISTAVDEALEAARQAALPPTPEEVPAPEPSPAPPSPPPADPTPPASEPLALAPRSAVRPD